MLAAAYLAATGAAERHRAAEKDPWHRLGPSADELIPLSSNEIRRLLATLVLAPAVCPHTVLRWSAWRRRRQHQARASHYLRRGHRPS